MAANSVHPRAADESIPAGEKGKRMLVKISSLDAYIENGILFFIVQLVDAIRPLTTLTSSNETSFFARSDAMDTTMSAI